MNAITINKPSSVPAKANKDVKRYDPITLSLVPIPNPIPPDHLLVRIHAASLNHRDHPNTDFHVKGQYPGITYPSVLGSDASGTIHTSTSSLHPPSTRVLINPTRGWIDSKECPEDMTSFGMLGLSPLPGTFAEYILVHKDEVTAMPEHLSMEEGAALPLAGVTAFRAVVTLGEVKAGKKVLVSGVGGGVALFAVQFAVAAGAEVWVTSGSVEKIERAVNTLGVKGGVNYKSPTWANELESTSKGGFDLVIDGAAGENMKSYIRLLKPGGIICVYGAVSGSVGSITFPYLWFKHATIKGVCMGSRQEFVEMVNFVRQKKIRPVVHTVVENGLDGAERAFDVMRSGTQFGKIVIANIGRDSEKL
ncbi:NAD(P)-binding protein [Rhizoclosmatium globosum]|uniref:NAD(P)-binding protein n=1 Tax=Rhizoclosmatium globosum TaxID=329046 RepID=A0A1Y2BPJ3_9FUNG|nr:NAD(P)-binding protein [Rhizoclosmatium globosum]|eukprot:ORY36674.1 NAD(P)-binding protein [Rhizoclosmatium globosum]